MGIELIIESNTKELVQAYKNKEITIEEMQESLKLAEEEEEYEVAVTFRDVLKMIENKEI